MDDVTRKYFIEAARSAARSARAPQSNAQLEIAVAAWDPPLSGFRWEIRHLGGKVIERSPECYRTALLARYAAVDALVS